MENANQELNSFLSIMSNWQNGLACVILSHIPICFFFFFFVSLMALSNFSVVIISNRTHGQRYDGICCILNFEDEIKNIAIYVCLLCWTARGPGAVLAGQKHISQPVILEGLNMTVWQTDVNKTNCGATQWLSLSLWCPLRIKCLKGSISQPLMLRIMVSQHTLAHLPVRYKPRNKWNANQYRDKAPTRA